MNRDSNYVDPRHLQRFFNEIPFSLTVLVVGKTGVGKSALVNSLIGEKVAEEGDDAIASLTNRVQKYQSSLQCQGTNSFRISVWDSPGYEDEEQEYHYFQQMSQVKQQSDIDLLLFCISMRDTRWRKQDNKALKAIDQAFGASIWDRAMIALTQANTIADPNGQVTCEAYERKLRKWTDKIGDVLEELGIRKDVPAVPTGSFTAMSLPDTDDWFSDFWIQAVCSMASDKRVGFLFLNQSRIKFSNRAFSGGGTGRSAGGYRRVRADATPSQSTNYTRNPQPRGPQQQPAAASASAEQYPSINLTGDRREKVKRSMWESFKEVGRKVVKFGTFVASVVTFGLSVASGNVPGIIASAGSFLSNLFRG